VYAFNLTEPNLEIYRTIPMKLFFKKYTFRSIFINFEFLKSLLKFATQQSKQYQTAIMRADELIKYLVLQVEPDLRNSPQFIKEYVVN
jgi:hypothetical protein